MITKELWGKTASGAEIYLYTLTNKNGLSVQVTTFGARLVTALTPDRDGNMANLLYGPDTLAGFEAMNNFYGATIGRYCNRIAGGKFELDGEAYQLMQNEGVNTLHGGSGVHNSAWESADDGEQVIMTLLSPDGTDGFPGNMTLVARFTLNDDNQLILGLQAVSDKTTICSLTNHAYWTLGGALAQQELMLNCDHYLSVDSGLIPTEVTDVTDTAFDFRARRPIGANRYDTHFVGNGNAPLAKAWSPATGRTMTIETDLPGVQLFTHYSRVANPAPGAAPFEGCAFCLEPQFCPDSPNHADWPTTTLRPGEIWNHDITITFGVE